MCVVGKEWGKLSALSGSDGLHVIHTRLSSLGMDVFFGWFASTGLAPHAGHKPLPTVGVRDREDMAAGPTPKRSLEAALGVLATLPQVTSSPRRITMSHSSGVTGCTERRLPR